MNETKPFGMTVTPYGWPVMHQAFVDFISFAIDKEEFREAFKKDSGIDLDAVVPKTPLDAMIDEASGFRDSIFTAFIEWVTKNHWGVEGRD